MKLKSILIAASVTFLVSTPVLASDFYISATSVEDMNGSLASVYPSVQTPSNADDYLDDDSCLGFYGPIGPYGPLGILGPVGDNSWNASYWISAYGDWSDWSDEIEGPLSESGPLGPNGPLSYDAYWTDLPAINDFSKQLQGGGVWSVLGPVGPLGALGPLGPLGPIGGHGYATDSNGRYVSGGTEMRTVSVPYNGTTRTYELFEKYSESYAENKSDNDTSFMAEGYIAWPYWETDSYTFTSNEDQFVTIVLVPEYQLDDFDIVVKDSNGNQIAYSNTFEYIDWIQIEGVAANTELTVEVELAGSWHYASKDYRLIVTGSTQYINSTDITGDHQVPMN